MISRLVTVDLILTTSLRLQRSMLFPLSEEQLTFYGAVRGLLHNWARKIEEQGLAVQLETIAENAVRVYLVSAEAPSKTWMNDLMSIGDQLIDRAREIELLSLNRSVFLPDVTGQEEMANALKNGEPVSFKEAATTVARDTNITRARPRFKEFLEWLRDFWVKDPRSEAWLLLNDILLKESELTTNAVSLFRNRYYPSFEVIVLGHSPEKIAKEFQNDANSV